MKSLSTSRTAFSLSLVCILFFPPALALHTCDFPAIFTFGDGNSDTGGFTAAFTAGTPPFYGQSYFKRPSGRASDGRILIDFIASSLGKPFLHPYLDSLGANFSYGVNFAQLLATIAPPKLILPVAQQPRAYSPFFLDIQIEQFRQIVNRSQTIREEGGVFKNLLPKKEYFSKALYTIDIGQNDLTQGLITNMTYDEIKAIIPPTVNSLALNVKKLYDLGARSFWIQNTGPFGCLPYMLTLVPVPEDQKDSVGCAIPHNDLAQYFNSKLKVVVNQLRKDLPLAAFTYVDVYTPKYDLYKEPKKYGFKFPLQACCGLGGKYNYGENGFCGQTTTINGTQIVVGPCENPSERICWDGVAFSQAADQIVFKRIVTGEFSDPPRPLNMTCRKIRMPELTSGFDDKVTLLTLTSFSLLPV